MSSMSPHEVRIRNKAHRVLRDIYTPGDAAEIVSHSTLEELTALMFGGDQQAQAAKLAANRKQYP